MPLKSCKVYPYLVYRKRKSFRQVFIEVWLFKAQMSTVKTLLPVLTPVTSRRGIHLSQTLLIACMRVVPSSHPNHLFDTVPVRYIYTVDS